VNKENIIESLSAKGLRVTPQRVAILEAISSLDNHPSAENIIEFTKANYPNISIGTVYKVLDSFVENKLLKKVKTESGTMRFDPLLNKHHHLYCESSDRIEDFEDETLDELISNYFQKKGIKNFNIQNIQLHITGTFKNK